ncbi:diguanylate cyclase [Bordetella bronchialis]|uniref:Diguanylate cyclase n=2 Tax=Bordetella bronchialis TaxID=463025 RepID=A0A193G5B5_9BORD|nr:diguanylate cyclase [Bordetella bronchialis]ANN74888.1 diguanylate cyclase [Bordetella bronchialis]
MHDTGDAALRILMYFIMPLWIAAGTADYLCHRRTDIAHTAGPKESVLHLLMFAEIGVPLVACLFLEINALVFLLMILAFIAHEATALWDVSYATSRRHVGPFEQHVHSFLELLPLAAGILVAVLHWPQFLALFGLGSEPARWDLRLKETPLPTGYIVFVLLASALLEALPYLEELLRGIKARRDARGGQPGRRAAADASRNPGRHA